MQFGQYLRSVRQAKGPTFSLRRFAHILGVHHTYLSKIELGEADPPSEDLIVKMADALGLNSDALLAMAGKISLDLQEAVEKRPEMFAALIRAFKDAPDDAILRVVREVRDGEW